MLKVQGVDVRLSGRKILDQVSFNIAPGEFTGLIGSNGAGKTTLFRVILGLQPTSAGDVVIAGRSRARGHQQVGFVPQKFLLDPDLPLQSAGPRGPRPGRPPPRSAAPIARTPCAGGGDA